jgi:iron complex transport system permease protein
MIKESKKWAQNNNSAVKITITIFIIILIIISSALVGRYHIEARQVLNLILAGPPVFSKLNTPESNVFYYIRLPRILLAMLVGASLSGAGSLFQGMFRNPLVSPDILGVSSGCCFGAALGILMPISSISTIQIPAFLFGLTAMIIAYGIAKASRGNAVIMLVLAGIVVSGFFDAALSSLKYLADPYEELPAIVFWIMGGFYKANWSMVLKLFIMTVPCMILLVMLSWKINILSLGDEEASSLGVNVKYLRLFLIFLATFMVAGSVSFSGTICWVGLIIPHISRMIVGSDHKISLPFSMLIGSGFVLLMDNFARCLSTAEIPVSILTSAVGAPFFAFLLITGKGNVWK